MCISRAGNFVKLYVYLLFAKLVCYALGLILDPHDASLDHLPGKRSGQPDQKDSRNTDRYDPTYRYWVKQSINLKGIRSSI